MDGEKSTNSNTEKQESLHNCRQSIAEIAGCTQDYMRTDKDEINSAWKLVVTEVVLSVWPLRIYILAWHYSRC